jgi:radical SAM superfamily enzyme YgiQ (UPF0313 family)
VAFSCTSPAFKHALKLANELKKLNPGIRTVFGGFHPSALPKTCLENECIDQIVVGEGEKAFLEILEGNNSKIIYGIPFEELDKLVPDRELIRNNRTIDLCQKQVGKRITSFQSVRVCPFRCAFCSERIVTGVYDKNKNPIRQRNPLHLLDEIMAVSEKYKLNHFKFVDATWNTSSEFNNKVIDFCEEKLRRDFRMTWEANVHAGYMTKELLSIMKKADCKMINVGCESGSQKILNDIKKGVTVDKIRDVFRWAKELGIERRSFFIIGMPNENMDDIKMTENLIREIEPDIYGVTVLCPYPGSDLYDHAKMKDYDWSTTDEYANSYWETKYFTNSQLKDLQKRLTELNTAKIAWHHNIIKDK